MIKYKDIDWDSWIDSYESWENYIKIKFKTWAIYTYTSLSAWVWVINEMIILAEKWDWLNAYINNNKPKFSNLLKS